MTSVPTSAHRISPGARRLLLALFTLATLLFAVLGQREMAALQEIALRSRLLDEEARALLYPGLLWFALAALSMAAARLMLRSPGTAEGNLLNAGSSFDLAEALRRVSLIRWGMTLLSLSLLAWVLLTLVRATAPSYAALFWSWIGATALAAIAWLPPLPAPGAARARVGAWLRLNRGELLALAGITLLAAGLRFASLATAPYAISGDEGSVALEVRRVLTGELRNPFDLIYGPYPSLVAFVLAIPATLFGLSIGSLRLVGALFGALAIPALYALARPALGRSIALVAALFLATMPMHLHYSRVTLNVVWDTFFFTGALAAFNWGMRRESRGELWPFVVAGLLGGWGQYAYTGSRLLPILIAVFVLYLAIVDGERLRARLPGLAVMALVFAVVSGPIYLYAARFPDNFNTRITQVGILQNGWLEAETAVRGQSKAAILWDQFRRSLFGFAFFNDRTSSWGPGTPLATSLLAFGLFMGLAMSLRRWRDPLTVLIHGWFWAIILSAGMLTVNPPTSNRLVGITPVLCLFAALGWVTLARMMAAARPREEQRLARAVLVVLFAGATGLMGVRAYQSYLAGNHFGGGEALIATTAGNRLAALPGDTTLVMLGAPRIYSDISPLAFLTVGYERVDQVEPLTAPPADPSPSSDLLFIILPERAGEMGHITGAFPEAVLDEVRDPHRGDLLYYELLVER